MIEFECDPMPRGGYRDFSVQIRPERSKMITTVTCGSDTVVNPLPPLSVQGTLKRISDKISRALQASAKAMLRGDEVRRLYWFRIAKTWMRKQARINKRWPALVFKK